jgi:ferrous iron transport protein B
MSETIDRVNGEFPADPEEVVALAGSPNVGKSVLFGALSDAYVDVSNYPGTTVETTVAALDDRALVDTPGVYGIGAFEEAERVARDIALDVDVVLNVVSATHLDRDLFLTLQLLDMGIPTIVALNMMDEAERDGIDIDVDELEAQLGVPVVPTVAVTGDGIPVLRERIGEATAPTHTPIEEWFEHLPEDVEATRAEKTLLVEADEPTAEQVAERGRAVADGGETALVDASLRDEVYAHRRRRVEAVTQAAVSAGRATSSDSRQLGDLLVRPLTGTPIALATLALVYYLIGDLVAQRLVDFLEVQLFAEFYNPLVRQAVGTVLPASGWAEPLHFLLVNDNLGLLTITVQYLFGVLLPLVVAFYLAIGVLEDSGVLPRLAVLTDRGMARIGLNGRAIVPMIVGVGCVTMAVITTRMTGSRRERLIATALLGLAIPCSAQLGVIMGLLAGLGLLWWFAYLGVLLAVFGVAGVVLDRVLPGEAEGLLTELPRLRTPRPRNVLRKTATRSKMFLREAGVLFGVAAIAVSTLDYLGSLGTLRAAMAPLTDLVGLPDAYAQVLVLGLVRRDFAAAGMTDLALSPGQIFVGLVVITLFVPCILSMTMIAKERDIPTGVVMWVGSWIVAFGVGALLAVVVGL